MNFITFALIALASMAAVSAAPTSVVKVRLYARALFDKETHYLTADHPPFGVNYNLFHGKPGIFFVHNGIIMDNSGAIFGIVGHHVAIGIGTSPAILEFDDENMVTNRDFFRCPYGSNIVLMTSSPRSRYRPMPQCQRVMLFKEPYVPESPSVSAFALPSEPALPSASAAESAKKIKMYAHTPHDGKTRYLTGDPAPFGSNWLVFDGATGIFTINKGIVTVSSGNDGAMLGTVDGYVVIGKNITPANLEFDGNKVSNVNAFVCPHGRNKLLMITQTQSRPFPPCLPY